jgi:hypothetical protein
MKNPFESPTPPEEGDEGFKKVMETPESEIGEARNIANKTPEKVAQEAQEEKEAAEEMKEAA